jgi:hypothetical protein
MFYQANTISIVFILLFYTRNISLIIYLVAALMRMDRLVATCMIFTTFEFKCNKGIAH